MQPDAEGPLVLVAGMRGGSRALLAEEGADFDLRLENRGAAQTLFSFNNDFTPEFSIFDGQGRSLGTYTPRQRTLRVVGDIGTAEFGPPDTITLAPGGTSATWVGVWSYRDPLPPGKYAFEAVHRPSLEAALRSNRVPFEIVPARVQAVALGVDGPARANSVMAWLATLATPRSPRLLIRQSGFASHRPVQVGGTAQGDFPADSRVAVAAMPMDARFPPLNWVAVVSGNVLQLIRHNMGILHSRTPAITLPVSDPVPVPRFPNRQHAVFLATAKGSGGPALVGVAARNGDPAPKPWTVRLSALPVHSACAFTLQGPITVLFSSDDGKRSRIHRVEVNEDGAIASPERVLRESASEVLAVVTDMRVGRPVSFVVLEADRVRHNHIGFAKIPLQGRLMATSLHAAAGWPMIEVRNERQPERARAVAFETDAEGIPWLALVNDRGDFFGGRLDGALALLREAKVKRSLFPHISVLADSVMMSCFDEDGMLFHSGIEADQH